MSQRAIAFAIVFILASISDISAINPRPKPRPRPPVISHPTHSTPTNSNPTSSNSANSQSCAASQDLRTFYGLPSLQSSSVQAGIIYCKSLKSSPACCDAATISNISTKSKTMTSQISIIIAARDKYLVQTREQVIPKMKANMEALAALSSNFIAIVNDPTSTSSNDLIAGYHYKPVDFTKITNLNEIISTVAILRNTAANIIQTLPQIKSNFTTYQKARTTCVTELIKLQNAAYCLACDPNNYAKGYDADTGDIKISSRVCTRLQNACYDFIEKSATQNLILTTAALSPMFDETIISMNKLLNGDPSGAASFGNDTVSMNETETTDDEETAAVLPDNCVRGNCAWICDNFFVNGQIDEETLSAGGDLYDDSRRLLEEIKEGTTVSARTPMSRHLDNYTDEFDPDSDEAGVPVTVSDDPSDTSSNTGKSASLLKNAAMGVVIVVVGLIA